MRFARMIPIVVPLATIVSGCVVPQPVAPAVIADYDASEAAYIHESGPNEIRGQAFLRQRGGGVVTCASDEVSLIAATAYAKERLATLYGTISAPARHVGTDRVGPPDPRYLADWRHTICDAQGNFIFERVADGDYFVVTTVVWEARGRYGMTTQGGPVLAPVSVRSGEVKRVIIAP